MVQLDSLHKPDLLHFRRYVTPHLFSGYFQVLLRILPEQGWQIANPFVKALLVNELHGQDFDCSRIVPAYPGVGSQNFVCGTPGAVVGQNFVNGDRYLESAYQYSFGHLWRNFGILVAFTLAFFVTYLIATELNSSSTSAAEFLGK